MCDPSQQTLEQRADAPDGLVSALLVVDDKEQNQPTKRWKPKLIATTFH